MSPKTAASIRYWVLFWIVGPLLVTALLMLIVAVGGYVAGPNAQGVLARLAFGAGFFAMLAPVIAAHVVTVGAIVGLFGVVAGVRPDWKLLAAIAVGLFAGPMVLYRLYFFVPVG
jgi:hypothetical protein